MVRISAERQTRNSIALLVAVHLALATFTVVVGFLMAGAAAQDGSGAAVWYRSLGVLGAVPLAVLAVTLVRLDAAPPPLALRLTRVARASYLAIAAVVVVAIVAAAARFAELSTAVVVMLQPIAALCGAPATLTFFRDRSAGSASSGTGDEPVTP